MKFSINLSALALMGLGALTLTTQANAQAFVNGSFEADNWFNGANYMPDVDGRNGPITGWSTFDIGRNPDYFLGINNAAIYGDTPHGQQYLNMGGLGLGGDYITQIVTGFIPGDTYTLSFAQSSEYQFQSVLEVSFLSGSSTPAATFLGQPYTSALWDNWTDYTYDFVANASSVEFKFLDNASVGNFDDVGLDNISVTRKGGSVPEPGSIALLVGVGVSGVAMLRRRRRN